MNPLTQIKNTQKITKREIELGLFEKASWHARFAHSAYIFAGGLDYELTEGDLLAVFAQYGELVDVHLVRDKTTGRSKGFAFLAYEDQRSTVLAVDNLSGAVVAGRKIRVEHVDNYKKRKAELEGEDPDAVPDEPPAKQQQQQQGVGARGAAGEQFRDGSPPPVVESGTAGGALGAGRLGDTWQAPNSLFALLAEAKPAAPAGAATAAAAGAHRHKEKKENKEKKEKKEKKAKKEKHKHDDKEQSRSRSRSRSISPLGQQQQQQPQQQPLGQRAAYGPPRPSAALQQQRTQQQGPHAADVDRPGRVQQQCEERRHAGDRSRHDSRGRDRSWERFREQAHESSRDGRERESGKGDRYRYDSSRDDHRNGHRQQGSSGRDGSYGRKRSRSRSR